jgi:hypothetical protein
MCMVLKYLIEAFEKAITIRICCCRDIYSVRTAVFYLSGSGGLANVEVWTRQIHFYSRVIFFKCKDN